MRRIFQNTTAIAACLSLMAPHMAAAQAAAEGDAVVLPPASETAAPDAAAPAEAAPADMPVEEPAEVEPAEPAEVEQAEPAEPETEAQPAEAPPAQPEEVDPTPEEAAELPESEPVATEADDEAEAATEVDADADAAPFPEAPAAEGSPAAAPAAEADAAVSAETEAGAEATAPAPAAPAAPAPEVAQPAEAQEADTAPDEATALTGGTVDAAQDGATVSAAALDDAASAEVTEEQVTEENSRSSSEEFETTVDAASTAGAAQTTAQASTGGGDGGSDIARALLLGLGGLAVGTMLSNNRQVALSTPDRIVVTRPDGTRQLIRDDVVLLRQPGSTVTTENFDDGSSRTVVTRADGSRVVTIRDADLRVLRRTLVSADGTQTILLDDTAAAEAVDLASLPAPTQQTNASAAELDEAQLRDVLMGQTALDRRFSLAQIRDVEQLRLLAPAVDVETVNFATGSAAIAPDQAESLAVLGNVIRETIASNPREMFLIEGHTDTVGDPAANLALSDRRAESVALALVEYFQVPPENMVVQGYGEEFPKVQQEGDVPQNRRAAVRRITDLLVTAEN